MAREACRAEAKDKARGGKTQSGRKNAKRQTNRGKKRKQTREAGATASQKKHARELSETALGAVQRRGRTRNGIHGCGIRESKTRVAKRTVRKEMREWVAVLQ